MTTTWRTKAARDPRTGEKTALVALYGGGWSVYQPVFVGAKQNARNDAKRKPRDDAKQKPRECDASKRRFFANFNVYEKMATELETNVDFLMALSSHESGWLDDHNARLHNLFGLTKAGGKNLSFKSNKECADFWVKRYKSFVQGATTMKDFVAGLRKIPYNSVDPDYDGKLLRQYRTVLRYREICGV